MKRISSLVCFLIIIACSSEKKELPIEIIPVKEPEAYSFKGQPLYRSFEDQLADAKSDSLIMAIKSDTSLNEESYINIGRTLTGSEYRKLALETYTIGLKKFPQSYKLLRHRGHRFINLHMLDSSIVDLKKAEALIAPEEDIFEYDANGKPGATYQHQIFYHIGVYYFLKKDYSNAALYFEKSLQKAAEANDFAGASDWLYNIYMRLNQKDKALAVLQPFTLNYNIDDQNYPYFRRILLYKSLISSSDLNELNKASADLSLNDITNLYGLSNLYQYQGDMDSATKLRQKILQSNGWFSFAYLSAEIDLKN